VDLHYESLLIGGQWVAPRSAGRITVVSASTEATIGSVPEANESDVDAAVDAARDAFDDPHGWAQWAPADRAAAMERLADIIERDAEEFAQRVGAQNGMPVAVARQLEGAFPAVLLRYYAGLAREWAFEETRPGLFGGQTLVRREPIGVVGAIVPWNFPQTLAAFKYAPAMAAGATVVLKPSPETVLDAFLLAEAVVEADIPAGVINIVPGGREIGAYLVSHPSVDKIAFTGSTAAGRSIAETCGRLLRPVTLELGGKSAAIVLDDAELELEEIAEQLFTATLLNNGQTCFLGTRVLAPRARYGEIVDLFTGFAGALTVGDALDPNTQIGPMASARQRERVESYIAKGRAEGARVTTGGGRPDGLGKGWFVEPTIFADVDNNHTIAQEEIFGPVLSVIPYGDEDEAVRIANDSDYGLGGTVWTSDPERGVAVAKRVQTGTIGVNTYLPDPTAPFGGVKASGIGRELGPEALANYQQLKSVYVRPGPGL
jgi:aldehyde dehydrogenase (NAD+)